MVRVFSLSLLAAFAAAAFAQTTPEQQTLGGYFSDRWSYAVCSSPDSAVQLKSIELSPDPPKPGQDLTVKVAATAVETIQEGAYADVVVKLGLIKLLTKRFNLCDEARAANVSIQCPVDKGDYVVSHKVALPREIPQAKFAVNVKGYTADEEDLFCLDLKVDFMKIHFPHAW